MLPQNFLLRDFFHYLDGKLRGVFPEREIREFAFLLAGEYLEPDRARLLLLMDKPVSGEILERMTEAADKLSDGCPVQYVIGKAWFAGMQLEVDSRVLIPRQETEELCQMAARAANGWPSPGSLVDIGTGSGCIAVFLKRALPGWSVTAADVSTAALEVAATNAARLAPGIGFLCRDVLDFGPEPWPGAPYNLLVSNPPYVTEEEKGEMARHVTAFEPASALFVPDADPLLFYRAIARFALSGLAPSGKMYLEINERFGQAVCRLLQDHGYRDVSVSQDMHGRDRFVSAVQPSR